MWSDTGCLGSARASTSFETRDPTIQPSRGDTGACPGGWWWPLDVRATWRVLALRGAPKSGAGTSRDIWVSQRRDIVRRASAHGVDEAVADAGLGDEHRCAVGAELLAELARV